MANSADVRRFGATPEEIEEAVNFFQKNKDVIAARALLCEDPAVALQGEYLTHKRGDNWGATVRFIRAVNAYKDFYGEGDDVE